MNVSFSNMVLLQYGQDPATFVITYEEKTHQ